MKYENCALCQKYEKLLKSHIIPRAVMKGLALYHGKFIRMDSAEDSSARLAQNNHTYRLLCSSCEQKIGKYEEYGINFFKGGEPKLKTVSFKDIKYPLLRQYLISLIWRASVANNFTNIKLSNDLEERARLSLLNNKPLNPLILGCVIKKLTDERKHGGSGVFEGSREFLMLPFRHNETYCFIMQGYILMFYEGQIKYKYRKLNGLLSKSKIQRFPCVLHHNIYEINKVLNSTQDAEGELKNLRI